MNQTDLPKSYYEEHNLLQTLEKTEAQKKERKKEIDDYLQIASGI